MLLLIVTLNILVIIIQDKAGFKIEIKPYICIPGKRVVAQPGSALAWGARGRWFESSPPDIAPPLAGLFMTFYTYILFSEKTGKFYCGQTNDISFRFQKHNNGLVTSTRHGIPWKLIGFVKSESRRTSMALEKQIKKRGIKRWLDENQNALITNIF